jgi:hypothetical protein
VVIWDRGHNNDLRLPAAQRDFSRYGNRPTLVAGRPEKIAPNSQQGAGSIPAPASPFRDGNKIFALASGKKANLLVIVALMRTLNVRASYYLL